MRSGLGIAGLLALGPWEGIGLGPGKARAAVGGMAGMAALQLGLTKNNRLSLPFWSDGTRWDDAHYWSTMQSGRRQAMRTYTYCDFDGDRREELLIRGPSGIEIVQWHADNAQWMPFPGDATALKDFNDANFYDPQYGYTLGTADIDGDGRPEIVGRFADGLRVYRYDLNTQRWSKLTTCERFGDDTGWGTNVAYYQTIQYGDIDGDGRAEVIARAGGGILVWKYKNGAWSQIAESDRFPDSANWGNAQYWATIQLADVDGDHAKELIARSGTGLEVWKLNASSVLEWKGTLDAWSDNNNWNVPAQYSTIQCGDLDGDGVEEIFGNGIDGLEAFKFHIGTGIGDGTFTLLAPRKADTSTQYGWGTASQYYTLQFADIDGDGAKEVIARAGEVGIMAFKYNTGTQVWDRFHDDSDINRELSDANGWGDVQYYATFQSAHVLLPGDLDYTGISPHPQAIVLGRSALGVDCYRWTGSAWTPCTRQPPTFGAISELQGTAYPLVSQELTSSTTSNIRALYNDLTGNFEFWTDKLFRTQVPQSYDQKPILKTDLPLPTPPQGVSTQDWQDAWNAVAWQIYWELLWVDRVNVWYDTLSTIVTETFIGNTTLLPNIKSYMDPNDQTQMVMNVISIIGNAAWAILGLPALDAGVASAMAGFIGTAASAGASLMPNNGEAYQTAVSNLEADLNTSFNAILSGNKSNQFQVTGGTSAANTVVPADYGLLKMIGENVLSGAWAINNTTDMIAAGQRGYAIACMQTLLPYSWQTLYAASTAVGEYSYTIPSGDPDSQPLYPYLHIASISQIDFNGDPKKIPTGTLDQVFQAQIAGTPWPLGVPTTDVFEGLHGWPKPNRILPNTPVPPPVIGLSPKTDVDIRSTTAITRDAGTGDVVVLISLANRGMTDATNVALDPVQLGGKSALPNATRAHHFLQSNFPEVLEVRFSGLASGLKTVLNIQGTYKGGSFGTRLRVTLP